MGSLCVSLTGGGRGSSLSGTNQGPNGVERASRLLTTLYTPTGPHRPHPSSVTSSRQAPHKGFHAVSPAGCRGLWVLSRLKEEWARVEGGMATWRSLGQWPEGLVLRGSAPILTGAAAGGPLRP